MHVVAGTYREDRHGGVTTPEPPKVLAGEALAEWGRLCDRLERNGTLTLTDDGAIYQAACLFAETEDYGRLLEETRASVLVLNDNLAGMEGTDLVACFQQLTKLQQ